MRFVFSLILAELISYHVAAQDIVQAGIENNKPYIVHTVTAGESLFAISRRYAIDAKELAIFNKTDVKTGLKKDQALHIPLTRSNFSVTACTSCSKVYYKAQPHEGLYRISVNFGNVGLASLKKLNNLSSDNISIGQNLLIGFLKNTSAGSDNTTIVNTEKYEVKEIKEETAYTIEKTKESSQDTLKTDLENKAIKDDTIGTANDHQSSVDNTEGTKSAFAAQYAVKAAYSVNGIAAIFKSTSGWNDGKYYLLMNNVAAGTIVKITAAVSSKVIYAKVLGDLPQIKQNEGLLARISNAAAAALSVGEDNIQVQMSF